ncbi:MAG: ribosome biogenesis GTPase Der [Candidatus Delongbacteria bacterium]|nr:ribosome biogenesis GTPase Der [Candidatus Delongbacteria bacterium]
MKKLARVAIIGRPNVGKSSLFNRLIGRKKSIVDDQPGVTRDRVTGVVNWDGWIFQLIDTGGLMRQPESDLELAVRAQIEVASMEADLILFLADFKVGVTTEDMEISRWLKQTQKPVIPVVNKVDALDHAALTGEFYKLGLGDPIHVSAVRGLFINELLDHIVDHIKPLQEDQYTEEDAIPVAILGKPNVGKSSLINRLIGKEISVVSNIPGTTRDAIDSILHYKNQSIRLIDTAGLRKKSRIKDSIEFYATLRSQRHIDLCEVAILMIDANQGITAQDIDILTMIREAKKGMILVINKWDVLSEKDHKSFDQMVKNLKERYTVLKYFPIISISALVGLRVFKILDHILDVHTNYHRTIATSFLNRMLEEITKKYPPPAFRGKEIRFFYITQIESAPPHFIIFSNHPDHLRDNYLRYLETELYQRLKLDGIHFKYSIRRKDKEES